VGEFVVVVVDGLIERLSKYAPRDSGLWVHGSLCLGKVNVTPGAMAADLPSYCSLKSTAVLRNTYRTLKPAYTVTIVTVEGLYHICFHFLPLLPLGGRRFDQFGISSASARTSEGPSTIDGPPPMKLDVNVKIGTRGYIGVIGTWKGSGSDDEDWTERGDENVMYKRYLINSRGLVTPTVIVP
jgi:hypothetical protein